MSEEGSWRSVPGSFNDSGHQNLRLELKDPPVLHSGMSIRSRSLRLSRGHFSPGQAVNLKCALIVKVLLLFTQLYL